MIRIDIPATSANLGSGFDSLGIALTMCNRVWMEEADELKITTTDKIKVPTDETNLIYWAARHLYQICGKTLPGLHIIQENNIPMARGLGSSSACIVAGILGANRMLGSPMSQSDSLTLRRRLKGTRITRARQSPAVLSLLPWRASACTAFPCRFPARSALR